MQLVVEAFFTAICVILTATAKRTSFQQSLSELNVTSRNAAFDQSLLSRSSPVATIG